MAGFTVIEVVSETPLASVARTVNTPVPRGENRAVSASITVRVPLSTVNVKGATPPPALKVTKLLVAIVRFLGEIVTAEAAVLNRGRTTSAVTHRVIFR